MAQVLHEITSKLTAMGLDVLKAELRSSKQAVKGVTTREQVRFTALA